jgi:hypothetical protein
MNIGFDFDKVLINYPPIIPYKLIDFFYKGRLVFEKNTKGKNLTYRFPGSFEQKIRVISHYPILRRPISKNIDALKQISKNKKNNTYLISSRYKFLEKKTSSLVKKAKLQNYFNGIYFNYKNMQPHLFKENIIRKLKIDIYIDDDLDLALYLAKRNPKLTIYWIKDRKVSIKLPKNITPIKDLTELKNKYLDYE